MSYTLIIRRTAKAHIEDAFRWYANRSPRLGVDFLNSVEYILARVEDSPLLYATVYQNVHRALLPRFPYGVFYFVQVERVVVIAVLHTSRDPKFWSGQH